MHQKLSHWVTIEHDGDDAPHRFQLGLIIAFLQLQFQLLQGWLIRSIVLMDQTVRIIEKRRHGGWQA